jgi:hypothetical protein
MNKRRLLKLADMLEADAKNATGIKFNLNTVVTPNKTLPKDSKTVPVSCGTQACAMGLAAISGEFKRSGGLSYQVQYDEDDGVFIETTMRGVPTSYDDAAMELFDISWEEANFLFTPSDYPTRAPKRGANGELYVAKRIRDFVAGKVAPKPQEIDVW